jgi:predicted secreted protein
LHTLFTLFGLFAASLLVYACDLDIGIDFELPELQGKVSIALASEGNRIISDFSSLDPKVIPKSYRWMQSTDNKNWEAIEAANATDSSNLSTEGLTETYIQLFVSHSHFTGEVQSNVLHLQEHPVIQPVEPPKVTSAVISNDTPTIINVTFDKPVYIPDYSKFGINVSTVRANEPTAITGATVVNGSFGTGSESSFTYSTTWNLTMNQAAVNEDSGYIFLSYTNPGTPSGGADLRTSTATGEYATDPLYMESTTDPHKPVIVHAILPLSAPTSPAISTSGVATWTPDSSQAAYISGYEVQIYDDTTDTLRKTLAASASGVNIRGELIEQAEALGDGDFYIKVRAISNDYTAYKDSAYSAASSSETVQQLDNATALVWDIDATSTPAVYTATWTASADSANTSGYTIQLYRDEALVIGSERTVSGGTSTSYNLTSIVGTVQGTYRFGLAAVARTDSLYYDSAEAKSDSFRVGYNGLDNTFTSDDFPSNAAIVFTRNNGKTVGDTEPHNLSKGDFDTLTMQLVGATSVRWQIDSLSAGSGVGTGNTFVFDTTDGTYGTSGLHTVTVQAVINGIECSASIGIMVGL